MKLKLFIYLLIVTVYSSAFGQTSDLSLEILTDNTIPYIRSSIKFTIVINNAGPDDASGVGIINELGDGYRVLDSISDNGIVSGNILSWYDLEVPAGSNVFLHFKAKVLASGNYGDRAEIVASESHDPNSDINASFDENDLDDRYFDDDEFEITSIVPIPSNFDNDRWFDKDDLDDDNDGIPDIYESHGIDPDSDYDRDGTPVYLDDNDNNFDIGDNDELVESFFDLDGDNIPNHLDYDSDGDGIFDFYEAGIKDLEVNLNGRIIGSFLSFGNNGLHDALETAPDSNEIKFILLNTDEDDAYNFLDPDDDNDGIPTNQEEADLDSDGNPKDAKDKDNDGFPDYLDNEVFIEYGDEQEVVAVDELGQSVARTATIRLRNKSIDVKLFTEQGHEITPEIQRIGNLVQLDISSLESGVYFLQFKTRNKVEIKRMVID